MRSVTLVSDRTTSASKPRDQLRQLGLVELAHSLDLAQLTKPCQAVLGERVGHQDPGQGVER